MFDDEVKAGMAWNYGSDRGSLAFIINDAVPNLQIRQANQTSYGSVVCLDQEDCENLEIRMVRSGIADVPDRFESITHTDKDGRFDFKGVPHDMQLSVYVEKKHYCWKRQMLTCKLERTAAAQALTFEQRGYEFNYKN